MLSLTRYSLSLDRVSIKPQPDLEHLPDASISDFTFVFSDGFSEDQNVQAVQLQVHSCDLDHTCELRISALTFGCTPMRDVWSVETGLWSVLPFLLTTPSLGPRPSVISDNRINNRYRGLRGLDSTELYVGSVGCSRACSACI